jgi:hypothetical protein
VVQNHILTHLYQYVELEVELVDGVACYKTRHGWWAGRKIIGPNQWYVCPKSGLLKRAPDWKRRGRIYNPPPPKPLRHWVSSLLMYQRRDDGSWLEVKLKPFPVELRNRVFASLPTVRDELLGITLTLNSDLSVLVREYGRANYAAEVRVISKADSTLLPIPIDLLRPPIQNVVR